jgi:antitoxin HicB
MNRLQALYPARIWHEDDVYYVQFLDLDNGFTFGENLTEAKEMAADVLSGLLASALTHNEPIPLPQETQGDDIYLIAPTVKVQAALLLRLIRANLPQEKMALAIGETKQTYQKIEQSQMIPTLSQLQEIAHVFGKELVIEFRG